MAHIFNNVFHQKILTFDWKQGKGGCLFDPPLLDVFHAFPKLSGPEEKFIQKIPCFSSLGGILSSEAHKAQLIAKLLGIQSTSGRHSYLPPLANFRSIALTLNGFLIEIAGIRHIDHQDKFNWREPLLNLKKRGFSNLLALESRDSSVVQELWIADPTNQFFSLFIRDYETLSLAQALDLCRLAKCSAKNKKNLAIYCGEGWGRSGTALACIILLSFLQQAGPILHESFGRVQDSPINIFPKEGEKNIFTTPLVAETIRLLRTLEKEPLVENPHINSSKGFSVEVGCQVRLLEKLETCLRKDKRLLYD